MTVKALAVELKEFYPITGADRIQIARVNGYNIIVGKDCQPGTQGLFFSTDTPMCIAEWFLSRHDLYRRLDKESNKNVSAGYFEPNGRVKSTKIKGVRSDGYFHQLDLKSYGLKVGDTIDKLDNQLLCYKYINEATERAIKSGQQKTHVSTFLPKHFDTENLRLVIKDIPVGSTIIVTEKYHGTSARTGRVPTKEKWYDKYLRRIGINNVRYAYVTGSRNVIIVDEDSGEKKEADYHGETGYRQFFHDKLKQRGLHEGEIIFYEILGYLETGTPIMPPHQDGKDTIVYNYNAPEKTVIIRIYRIAYQLSSGKLIDLDYDRMCMRASELGFLPVNELDRFVYDGDSDKLIKRVLSLTEGNSTEGNHIKEGCVLDIYSPHYLMFKNRFVKQKSIKFMDLEGIFIDKGFFDLEDAS